MKTVWHKSDLPEDKEKGWHKVSLEDIDANHAVDVDPEHWSLENPDDIPPVVEAAEPVEPVETEHEGEL